MQISCEFASDFFDKRLHYCTTIVPQKSSEKPLNRRAASDEKPIPGKLKTFTKFIFGPRTLLRSIIRNLNSILAQISVLTLLKTLVIDLYTGIAQVQSVQKISEINLLKRYRGHLQDTYLHYV